MVLKPEGKRLVLDLKKGISVAFGTFVGEIIAAEACVDINIIELTMTNSIYSIVKGELSAIKASSLLYWSTFLGLYICLILTHKTI